MGSDSGRRLNKKLEGSFDGAVAADFDGNGKTDIAFNDGSDWRFSADGRSALATLRDGKEALLLAHPALKSLLIGRFEGGPGAQVLAFERRLTVPNTRACRANSCLSGGAWAPATRSASTRSRNMRLNRPEAMAVVPPGERRGRCCGTNSGPIAPQFATPLWHGIGFQRPSSALLPSSARACGS